LAVLTDKALEIQLKHFLEKKGNTHELSFTLMEALTSTSRTRKQTALRFLQLHPEWLLWKKDFEPWLRSLSDWPWPLVLSWIFHQRLNFTLDEKSLLKKVIEKQNQDMCLARSVGWQALYPEVEELKAKARDELQAKVISIRTLLYEELQTWKSQRLREQELKVLARLKKKFPQDIDIERDQKIFKENQALEKLQSRIRNKRSQSQTFENSVIIEALPEALRQSLQKAGEENPNSFYDLALFCCFIEDWNWAFHLIRQAPESQPRDWLEVEILLKLERFVDVLQALITIESRWAQESETFFSSAYARALAFYGLGKKERALEVLESLLASRPTYRQAAELVDFWRNHT
jgi:hypothetical protein